MKRYLMPWATPLALLGVIGVSAAGAAPIGSYTVSCQVGGQTSVTWQHAKLDQVSFAWSDQAGAAFPGAAVPILFKQPHGYVITPTPKSGTGGPTSVTVSFERADGSGSDQVQSACT